MNEGSDVTSKSAPPVKLTYEDFALFPDKVRPTLLSRFCRQGPVRRTRSSSAASTNGAVFTSTGSWIPSSIS